MVSAEDENQPDPVGSSGAGTVLRSRPHLEPGLGFLIL